MNIKDLIRLIVVGQTMQIFSEACQSNCFTIFKMHPLDQMYLKRF